ncbi:MAG TPA: DedA family protein [Mycobacteriales bacterium]|nr:DedA family protein [Mycobacteriales bacterium]
MLPEWILAAAGKPLPGPFDHLEGTLHDWGYLAVAGFLFLEDFGVPVPGETMLIAAALYAGAGQLDIWVVGVVGFVAAVLGDNVGYLIGRSGGRELVLKYGKVVFITPERLDRAEDFFTRHGGQIVFVARFIEGLRQLNGIIAGIVEMPWRRFLLFNMLGAAVWVALWSSLGYLAGNHVEAIVHSFTYIAAGVGVLIVGWIGWHLRRRRRRAA